MNYAKITTRSPGNRLQEVETIIKTKFPTLNCSLTFVEDEAYAFFTVGKFIIPVFLNTPGKIYIYSVSDAALHRNNPDNLVFSYWDQFHNKKIGEEFFRIYDGFGFIFNLIKKELCELTHSELDDDGIGQYIPEGDFSTYGNWVRPKLQRSLAGHSKYRKWDLSQKETLIQEFIKIASQEFPGL